MFQKKFFSTKKFVKGFTLVEIIVVLVILAILAAATIPSLLGFIDDAKFKTIDNEARVVRNAAQAYATEQSAGGKTDESIASAINGVINSSHALHNLLQNDANGTVFMTEVKNGRIKKFNYTKEIIGQDEDVITDKIRYVAFDDEKTSLLHATSSVTTLDIDDFEARIIENVTTSLTSSISANVASSLKANFVTELGSDVVDLIYPVGSYYVSNSSTSPATLFSGTTWTQITNRFLYCAESGAGDTGGSSTHTHTTGDCTLTIEQIPSHNHRVSNESGPCGANNNEMYSACGITGNSFGVLDTGNSGGGQAHNHGNTGSASSLPPYIKVYCWQRTA